MENAAGLGMAVTYGLYAGYQCHILLNTCRGVLREEGVISDPKFAFSSKDVSF